MELRELEGATAPFVCRRDELAWWNSRVEEILRGQPRVILLPGEPGIGKTRFLRQVETTSEDSLHFHYSRCREEMSQPYLPFVDGILGPILETLGDLDATLGDDAEPIRQLLQLPRTEGRGSVRAPTERDRYRLFGAVSHAVIAAAQRQPMVLVFDDLHWADRPSLDLLRHLVFAAADSGERQGVALMIVAAYRPVDAENALDGVLASLRGEQICQTLALPEFDEAETADLILSLHLGRPSPQLVATVVAATGGNPLFVEESLHQLLRDGAVQERGGELVTAALAHDLRLPQHVVGAIAARMQGLSERCRNVLGIAASLGGSFTADVIASVGGCDAREVEPLLAEARTHGLVRSEGDCLRFAHPLVQHVSFEMTDAEQRARQHGRIAAVLDALSANDGQDRSFEIAHHLIAAGDMGQSAHAVGAVRMAADRALEMYAWGEAARYYEIAASAAQQSDHVSPAERAELHYRTAYSYHHDRHPEPCLAHYDLAVELYRASGDRHGIAKTLADKTRAQFELVPVPYGTLIDVGPLEEAVRALGDSDPPLSGRIWETIGEVYWTARQPEKAREMSDLAVRIGLETDDTQLCAYARLGMALALLQQLDLRAALECYAAAEADAARAPDLWLQAQALQRRPLVLTWMGRLGEASVAADESTAFARRLQDWSGCSLSSTTSTAVALARGAFGAVEQHASEGMRMLRRSSYPWGALLFLPSLAAARALRGEWAAAEDAITLLEEPGRVFPEPGASVRFVGWVYRQLIALYAERLEVADAAQFARAVQGVLRDAGSDINTIVCACALVEIGAAAGEPAIVAAAAASLNDAVARGAVLCNSWSFLVPRVCGVAATVERRWDEAAEHFEEAIRIADAAGMRPELGRTYLDAARMVVARGGGERAGAIDRLQRAAAIFHELEMWPFLQQADAFAKTLGTSLPVFAARPNPNPANLSDREKEVLVYLALGRSDAEMADELLLTHTTLTDVLVRVLQKTDCVDRAAAVAYAVCQGLGALSPQRVRAITRPPASLPTTQTAVIMFTDIEDYTSLIDRLGDLRSQELLRIHNNILRDCLGRHNGCEIKHTGDGLNAWFGSAAAALGCAAAIQRGLAAYNRAHPESAIRVRIGLNAGTPIIEEGQLFGASVNAAARICARANGDQSLVSDVVRQLAAGRGFTFLDQGSVALKGLSQPFRLHAVAWDE